MSSTLNMTTGSIRKQLLAVALPLIVCDIVQQLYNTVDAFIISQYSSSQAFAALGIAETFVNLLTFILIGLCVGISVILATEYGAKNLAFFRQEIFIGITTGLGVTILLTLGGLLLIKPSLLLLHTPAEIIPLTLDYLQIYLLGLVFTFLYNFALGTLRAVGNTKVPALILLVSLGVKLAASYSFIVYGNFAIQGAAYSTICTQVLACLIFFGYIKFYLPELLYTKKDRIWNKELLQRTFSYGSMTALQQSSLYLGKIFVQLAVNSLGTAIIATFAAATRLESFINILGNSGAAAISIFVAQNRGALNYLRAKQGFFQGTTLLLSFGIIMSGMLGIYAHEGLTAFLGTENLLALQAGISYLHIVCAGYFLCYLGSSFVGYFRGCGCVDVIFWGTTMQIASRAIVANLYASSLGLDAVAYGTLLGWILIVIYQIIIYKIRLKKL